MIATLASLSVKPAYQRPIFLIFSGESNSGGQGPNSSATIDELSETPLVRIACNDDYNFENLHIGVNNQINHTGLASSVFHGWELQLKNRVESEPSLFRAPVFLAKRGKGGSTISQWNTGGAYYLDLVNTINTAKTYLIEPRMFWFYTQGINDSLAGTNLATWKTATKALFAAVRSAIGENIPILIPRLMPQFDDYNAVFEEIILEITDAYMVGDGLSTLNDAYHYTYLGYKRESDFLINKMLELL